jgi:BioD-like phosphotransacetylase family protein
MQSYNTDKKIKKLTLAEYISEYHNGDKTSAANSLILVSSKKPVAQQNMYRMLTRNYIVIIEGDKYTLCKIAANSLNNT